MRNKMFYPFSNRIAVKLSVYISVILNTILIVGNSYNQKIIFANLPLVIFVFISNTLLFYLLYTFNFFIVKSNRKNARVLVWTGLLGSVCIATIFSFLVCYLTFAIHINKDLITGKSQFYAGTLAANLITSFIVIISTYLLSSVYENQQNLLKNEKLVAENIRTRYEVLKSQVDPHFLFNTLNTLDGLISIDTNKAHEYVQNLSSVFRYTIGNKEIIHLGDELDFTEAYISLMKIRYGDSLHVNIHIDSEYKNWYIMPISLQLLVENAIKHNVLSNKQPLIIHIETTLNSTIKIWNIIQPKNTPEAGEGIGLSNLAERYDLLFQKEILISSDDIFCVELPLIKDLSIDKFPDKMKTFTSFCS